MKYDIKIAFLLTYLSLLLLASIGIVTLCAGNFNGGESKKENRSLQAFPEISAKAFSEGSMQEGLEGFLSDQMPLRNEILSASAAVMGLFDIRTEEERIINASVQKDLEHTQESSVEDSLLETAGEKKEKDTGMENIENTAEEKDTTEETDVSVADTSIARRLYYTKVDGGISVISHFEKNAMEATIAALNAYREALPEDGTVTFTYVPDSQRADVWLFHQNLINGWHSEVEETLQANVLDGVYVYSSVNELNSHMQAGEAVYYRTDHHWSGLGAYYMVQKMMESRGIPVALYQDYAYTVYDNFQGSIYQSALSMAKAEVYDRLEIPSALAPADAAEYTNVSQLKKKVRYMEPERKSYGAYLGGTHGPYFVIETGFHTGRNALVISNSFGNAFIPYLVPYYDRVCQLDLRNEYQFVKQSGRVSEYLQYWGIDDVYFIVSQGDGVNAAFMRVNARKYL